MEAALVVDFGPAARATTFLGIRSQRPEPGRCSESVTPGVDFGPEARATTFPIVDKLWLKHGRRRHSVGATQSRAPGVHFGPEAQATTFLIGRGWGLFVDTQKQQNSRGPTVRHWQIGRSGLN